MNKAWNILIVVVILALGTFFLAHGDKARHLDKQSAYDKIMQTRTLRCSYTVWAPFLIKDTKTGEMGGVYYDLLERIGKDLNLKIEWTEEVGMFSFLEGLRAGRTDLYCSPVTPAPERAVIADFTMPVAYLPYFIYAKADDHRFDNNYNKLNASIYSMMSIDGYLGSILIREQFPKAKYITLSDFTTDADVLLSIAAGKADAAPSLAFAAQDFMKNNPYKVRRVDGPSLRNAAIALALPKGEEELKALINTALAYYADIGFLDKIFDAYSLDETKLIRLAKPYGN